MPGSSADGADRQENPEVHGAQSQDEAQVILGKTGDEKQNEGHQGPLVFHEEVEALHGLPGDDAGDEVLFQPMPQQKCHHGPEGQADGGVGEAQGYPEKVAA